jgi:hypothetical protein
VSVRLVAEGKIEMSYVDELLLFLVVLERVTDTHLQVFLSS